MGHKHTSLKNINLFKNKTQRKGKKKYRKVKFSGTVGMRKHYLSGIGVNRANSIARNREYNREEEAFKKSRDKRKCLMCGNVIDLFRKKRSSFY